MADTTAPAVDGELCTVDPDIAGLGVVLAFTFTAGLTLTLSVACGILKLLDPDERVHGQKHDIADTATSNPDPKLSVQHRIVSKLDAKLKKLRETANASGREPKLQRWHSILSTMLLGLSVNQIVAGVAISISALVVFRSSLIDPNVDLANDLSLLSVTSQLAVSTVLYRPNKWSIYFRSASFYAYVCLLTVSTAVQQAARKRDAAGGRGQDDLGGRKTNWIFLVVVLAYGVWVSLLVNLADSARGRKTLHELSRGSSKVYAVFMHWSWVEATKTKVDEWKTSQPFTTKVVKQTWRARHFGLGSINWYHLFVHTPWFRTCMGFTIGFALTAVALASAIIAKLNADERCVPAEESQWTFGNILALGMIAALLVPGLDAYFDSREHAKHRYVNQETQTDDMTSEATSSTGPIPAPPHAPHDADSGSGNEPVRLRQSQAHSDEDDGDVTGAGLLRRDTLELEAQNKHPKVGVRHVR
ncbi:hypothetical protein LTR85_002600 [Meristemomyces frigidus]|nr:hypothetical protein LTR85_002600 [Meristemomyces frigidus]